MTKTLQIIRVDHELVQKANLQIGNNIIGRGAATGCNDERVLKHALIINLSPDDQMKITPMVPCYMKPSGCARWRSLKLGNSSPIKPGDVCSLLPDKCWFKIISVPETMEKNDQTLKRKVDEDSNDETNSKKICSSSSIETLIEFLNDKNSSAECLDPTTNGNDEYSHVPVPVLQETYSASCAEESDVSATCSKVSADLRDVVEASIGCKSNTADKGEKAEGNVESTNQLAVNNETGERTRWDREVRSNNQAEAALPMNDESRSSSPVAARRGEASISDRENPEVPKREKCMYGDGCYRRNPNHKNNYSHPGDVDYDEADDREECPYGTKCYRKNLRHKAQFKHTTVPRRRRAAATVQQVAADTETDASSAESVDESDYEPSIYTESSDTKSDSGDSRSEWEDGTTG